MKVTSKQTYGNTQELTDNTWSARARLEKLRNSPTDTYVPPKKSTKVKTK